MADAIELTWTATQDPDLGFRVLRNSGNGFEEVTTLPPSDRLYRDRKGTTSDGYAIVALNLGEESRPNIKNVDISVAEPTIDIDINGANIEINLNKDIPAADVEIERSTNGFQNIDSVANGIEKNNASAKDKSTIFDEQVEYRAVVKTSNQEFTNTVAEKLPKFAEVPDAELSTNNKPVFTNIGIPNSASKIKIHRATGVEPVFPGDYSVVQESSSQIAKFRDDAAPSESVSSYAFTTIDNNGNESNPDIRQVFAPANDAAVLKDKNTQ